MKLIINNIGPLTNADIDIDGITVIAGQNNVGKSTIGKTLYALLQYMDVWRSIYVERCAVLISSIFDKYNVLLEDLCLSIPGVARRRTSRVAVLLFELSHSEDMHIAIEDYKNSDTSQNMLLEYIDSFCDKYIAVYLPDVQKRNEFKKTNSYKISKWKEGVIESIKNSEFDELIMQQDMVYESIKTVFENQAIKIGTSDAKIKFTDSNGRIINIKFDKDKCNQDLIIRENNRVFYIETSKLFDFLSDSKHGDDQEQFLQFLMRPNIYKLKNIEKSYNDDYHNMVRFNLVKKNYDYITQRLEHVMGGNAHFYQKIGLEFKDQRYTETIHAGNVSAGLKSLALLEYALRLGAIEPGDVLILDEPEINLHPEWQVEYARSIIKLQKEYKVNFIVTSHSPYFIRAIECYSDVEDHMSNLNVYELTRGENGTIDVENVSYSEFGMSQLYDDLSAPLETLDKLLEDND